MPADSGADRCSQAAVHLAIDVQDIDCEFLLFTATTVRPDRIGVLYAKHEHLVPRLRPTMAAVR